MIAEAKLAPRAAPSHFLSSADLDRDRLDRILAAAIALREQGSARRPRPLPLTGRQVALLFEKPSLRTRVTFDIAVDALGGHAIYLGPEEVGIGRRESAVAKAMFVSGQNVDTPYRGAFVRGERAG